MDRSLRLKRCVDLAFCLVAAPVLLPLALVIALGVRLTSPGPVLYRAPRVGRDMGTFAVLKFRTMYVDSSGPALTRSGDPRITGFGRWLRASKLDELPQLLNVLRGQMSVVGPRPEDRRFVNGYSRDEQRVLSLPPGITGLGSIRFRHEQEIMEQAGAADLDDYYRSSILPIKLALELEYVETWTVLGDLRIVGRTIAALVVRRPA